MAETIAGLVSAAVGAAGWILQCITKQSELFEKDIENNIVPINEEFLRIHTSYVRMFNLLGNYIRVLNLHAEVGKIGANEALALYRKEIETFRDSRQDIEGIRSTFRAKIGSVIPLCTSEQARTYFAALCAYVVNDEDDISSREDIDLAILITMISKRERGDDAFDSPSARLLYRLEEEVSLEKAQRIITTALAGLSLKESSVLKAYFVLRARHL